MDEQLRAIRRRRRRERRLLRRIGNLGPLLLVGLAYLLSAGVVKIMEVPRPPVAGSTPAPERRASAPAAARPRSLSMPDTSAALPDMLSTSILDGGLGGPPDKSRAEPAHPEEEDGVSELEELAPFEREPEETPRQLAPVPEPGSAVLLATGLLLLAAKRRRPASVPARYSTAISSTSQCRGTAHVPARYSTAISSTSKVSTAPGGMTPGTPASP